MKKKNWIPKPFPFAQVTVWRPRRCERFGSLVEALESFRPWVAFDESLRIFEQVFHIP